MHKQLRLVDKQHTGTVQPHNHTSYISLAILLIIGGVFLLSYSALAWTRPGPEAGSIGLSGTVPNKPPTTAATIESPKNNQRFTTSPIVINGTCPKDTLIEVFKNDIFAGSTLCDDSGRYETKIDLLIGRNTLTVIAFDALNQAGPDSKSVVVFYDILPSQADPLSPLSFGGQQLLINTDAVFRGSFPSETMTVPLEIIGGRAPYAVNIQWGDSTNKVVSRPNNAPFQAQHAYQKAGTYQLSVQATDADGRVAFINVASIINGQPDVIAPMATTSPTSPLLLLWPLYAATIAVVISFWLGEQREKRLFAKHGIVLS